MTLTELVNEIKETTIRIEGFCRYYEKKNFTHKSYKGIGLTVARDYTYIQQRAKLTSYFYFLELLGQGKLVRKLQKERGYKVISKKAGTIIETMPYVKPNYLRE